MRRVVALAGPSFPVKSEPWHGPSIPPARVCERAVDARDAPSLSEPQRTVTVWRSPTSRSRTVSTRLPAS